MAEALIYFAAGLLAAMISGAIVVGPMVFREWRATRRMPTGEDLLRELELPSQTGER